MLQKIPFPNNFRQRQIIFLFYIILIVVVSLVPSDSRSLPIKHIDKVGHFLAYVLMAVLALVSYEKRGGQISAVLLTVVIAVLLEWGQSFVPGRLATLTDGITNILGLLVGVLLYWFYFRRLGNSEG
jgi:VanZ family protein